MPRLDSLRGCRALVTGASSGIGRALAKRIAAEGGRVALVARRQRELDALADEIRASAGDVIVLPCDVGESGPVAQAAKRAIEHFGGIDLLVNNAGYGRHRRFLDWDVADVERMMRVNYLGAVWFTKALLPQMVARRRGWVIFVSSVAGRIATPEESAYAASKSALLSLAESLSLEVEDSGVHVMSVLPGVIRTPFFDEETFQKLPPYSRRSMVEVDGLVDAVLHGLARGRHQVTYPRALASAFPVAALAPGFMRRQVRRITIEALARERQGRGSRLSEILSGAATAAAAVVTLGASYRRFTWAGEADERHVARTDDGWNLALYRYRPHGTSRGAPVVCSHGMAGSHLIYDLGPDVSLARTLARNGFDTWLVDLRGRGESWPDGGPRRDLQWCFDDFAERDLPAALARVCELAGAEQAFWLGMEMSGQALYAASILGRAGRVRGGITFGSPALTPRAARVPGVTAPPKLRLRGRVPFRSGSRLAGPILAYARSAQLESSFRACNTDPLVAARYFRNGIPDEASDLVDQFREWVEHGVMRSRNGSTVYSDRLAEVKLPLLVLAAAHDLQRPAEAVRATFDALGSADKRFLVARVADGFSVDFGHDDLLAGRAAPAEVFPRILAWLEEHEAERRAR